MGSLTTLHAGDPMPAELSGIGSWDGPDLRVAASNFTLQNYYLPDAGVYSPNTNFTVQNCVIHTPASPVVSYGVACFGGNTTVRDCTIVGGGGGSIAIGGDFLTFAYRCDCSGFEDGIGTQGASTVDQCYVHDLDYSLNPDLSVPHNDAIQRYQGAGTGGLYSNNYLVVDNINGENACLTLHDGGCTANNNYMIGGGFFLRIETGTGHVVTNNNFGPLRGNEIGLVSAESGTGVTTWSNNRDSNGNLISAP
jgi:hypothetical protein